MSSFTDSETQEIKNRLGYGNLTANARPYFDIAKVFEDIIQNFTDDYGIARVRTVILPQLRTLDGGSTDATGGDVMAARLRYKADELVGRVKLNKQEHRRLLDLKEYWICELESTLKVGRAAKMLAAWAAEVF